MTTHSPELWYIGSECFRMPNGEDLYDNISSEDANSVCRDIRSANAERIVACVNACSGIPNEELEETIKEFSLRARFYSNNFPIPEWVKRAWELHSVLSVPDR